MSTLLERPAGGDRRIFLVQMFLLLIVVVILVGLLIYFFLSRASKPDVPQPRPDAAKPRPDAAPPRARTQTVTAEDWPKINEYLYEDRYVVEVVAPGMCPMARVTYDHSNWRPMLTVSWAPARPGDEDGRRYSRREWQPAAFTRTILLPHSVAPPKESRADGILRLTFPRVLPEPITPRKGD